MDWEDDFEELHEDEVQTRLQWGHFPKGWIRTADPCSNYAHFLASDVQDFRIVISHAERVSGDALVNVAGFSRAIRGKVAKSAVELRTILENAAANSGFANLPGYSIEYNLGDVSFPNQFGTYQWNFLPDSLKGKCVPDFAKKIDLRVQDWETLPRSLRVTLKNEDVQAAANVYYTARFTAQVTVYQMKSRDAR